MTRRILVAGFQHETNTFAPTKAGYENFVRGEGFPQLVRGDDVLSLREVNIPAGGFLLEAERLGYETVPVIWAGASPSAHVRKETYDRIVDEILQAAALEEIHGIYLDLHGAMVAEHTDDGEGTLLKRLRTVVGDNMPIVVSLDLHANVTQAMIDNADAMVAYRTYPHIDMADTGKRAAELMSLRIGSGKLHRFSLRLPFLIPINGMCTLLAPAKSLYERLEALESTDLSLSFSPGFPAADFEECGPVVWGYGTNEYDLQSAVTELHKMITDGEDYWEVPFLDPDEAVTLAITIANGASKPVVIADTQDNPGAGGDSNTTGMIKALLRNGARSAGVGLLWDPSAVQEAMKAGVGGRIFIALGGQSSVEGDSPLEAEFEVIHLSNGQCRFAGPMMHGMEVDLGPVACLQIEGVKIAVSSSKSQMLDRVLYRVAGIEPENMSILVNKSSVHFRADFEPIAERVLVAKAPGPMIADPADIPWTKLKKGIRLKPNGLPFN
jgi:microcystin degradation protein MlrC